MLVNNSRWFGGAELYLEQLMRACPAEISLVLAARSCSPPRLLDAAVAAHVPIMTWRAGPVDLWRLYREMRGSRVVHLNMAWSGDNAHAVALSWLCRRPVVATVHIWVEPGSTLRRRVMGLGYRRFARVVAVSAEIEAAVASQLGVARDALTVVPNGVPYVEPVLRTASPTVVIGGLGRLVPAKGFDLLIEAVRRLRAQGHDVRLVIAGEGTEQERLERAAAELPVEFLGFVSDTGTFLAGLDVFCLPSRWEGLPFALLEAMMAGVACVGADVGDVAVALDQAGSVVPPEDVDALTAALEELVLAPDRRMEMGAAAHRRARDGFSLEASVTRTVAVYCEAEAFRRPAGGRRRTVAD